MRQIGIRELRGNLAQELEKLPFEVTKHDEVIAVVVKPGFSKETVLITRDELCVHGSPKSLCKVAKCRKT